ncbi:hypothetical protein, partial [Nocardia wallacei]
MSAISDASRQRARAALPDSR